MYNIRSEELGLWVDLRRMGLSPDDGQDPALDKAVAAMSALESGEIANPDENRQVGHYWLRNPSLAPQALRAGIESAVEQVESIASELRAANTLEHVVLVGIGGSVLGTQVLAEALCEPGATPQLSVLDNTDPDGIDRVLAGVDLAASVVVVASKSGGTMEVRNGLIELQAAFEKAGVDFASRAIAVSLEGSGLWNRSVAENWCAQIPVWPWVGGRFSVTSAVGLLPLALLGVDVRALLEGAATCDEWTRGREDNPALGLALAWHRAGRGRGEKAMVVMPYKDRLAVIPRWMQQIVMESIGKEVDLSGQVVHQGMAVYGNKGSTDQHSLVQQLRGGPDDFFATFVAVLSDRQGESVEVADGIHSGDCLLAMMLGTRRALSEAGKRSLTVVLDTVDARSMGGVIALFERAVGFYGTLIGVNAYNQPGVEAGKRAADDILELSRSLREGRVAASGDDAELLVAYRAKNRP
ncbi:MAG: glucose-6-phosphate isomerase [Myxococcota bacterium]|nr:glucose-6-phosphate isomerase [Myxococcota bacterium]